MAMEFGRLLRDRKIQSFDDRTEEYVNGSGLGHSRDDAAAENLDEGRVCAGGVCQNLWRWGDPVELVEQDQAAQVLNRVLVPPRTGPHRIPRLGSEGNKDVRYNQVKGLAV